MKYAPEWNHLEPNGAVQGGVGAGQVLILSVAPATAQSALNNAIS